MVSMTSTCTCVCFRRVQQLEFPLWSGSWDGVCAPGVAVWRYGGLQQRQRRGRLRDGHPHLCKRPGLLSGRQHVPAGRLVLWRRRRLLRPKRRIRLPNSGPVRHGAENIRVRSCGKSLGTMQRRRWWIGLLARWLCLLNWIVYGERGLRRSFRSRTQWNLGIRDTQGLWKTVLNYDMLFVSRSISMHWIGIGTE